MSYGLYTPEGTGQAYQVLLEVAVVVSPFWENMVVVGGWSAFLLVRSCAEEGYDQGHVGSLDVDLMLAIPGIKPSDVPHVRACLEAFGYRSLEHTGRRFSFLRETAGERPVKILIDFMVPDTVPPTRPRVVERNGLWAICLEGGDLAAKYRRTVSLEGVLPDGRPAQALISVVDFAPFLVLKGLALGDRREKGPEEKYAKHAYDIACVIHACGPKKVAGAVRAAMEAEEGESHETLHRAMSEIGSSFGSREAGGPAAAARIWAGDEADVPLMTTQAFESVAEFLEELGFSVAR